MAQEALPSRVGVEVLERCPLPRGQKFPGQPVGTGLAVPVLDVDADAGARGQAPGDGDQRDTSRVRDVEIDARTGVGEAGSAARAAREGHRRGVDAEDVPEHHAQRGTPGDPSSPQCRGAEAVGASAFRRGQHRGEPDGVFRAVLEPAPPEGDARSDRRQLLRALRVLAPAAVGPWASPLRCCAPFGGNAGGSTGESPSNPAVFCYYGCG